MTAGLPMQGRHSLACGIERNLVEPRRCFDQGRRLYSRTHRRLIQGNLSRITNQLAGDIGFRIIAQQQGLHQARCRVGLQSFLTLPPDPERLGAHAILRQRTGLVGTDKSHRTQGFHRRQPSNQRMLPDHPPSPKGQRYGRHCRQRLGNGRHRQADGGQQHQDRRLAAQQPDPENDGAHRQHQQRQPLPELSQPLLQRRSGFLFMTQQFGDLAEFRVKARRNHDAGSTPIGSHSALVSHIGTIAQRRIQLAKQHVDLLHRLGLPGQGRLFDLQPRHVQQAQIGRNDIAGFQHHQITGHQLTRRYCLEIALTHHLRGCACQSPERGHGALRPILLHKADDRVQHHNDNDGEGIGEIAEQTGNQPGHHQYHDHEIGKLAEEHP